MKKGLLILICVLITAGFVYYIFDIKLDNANYTQGGAANADIRKTSSVSLAQPAQFPEIIDDEWKLVWEEEFDDKNLNMEYWTKADLKDSDNRELQYYTPDNAYIDGGCLYITAKKEKKEGKSYTSAMVQTMDKYSFCYGRIEARMSLPTGTGLLPAFWLMPYNGDTEIDVAEMIGNEPGMIYGVNHYNLYTSPSKTLNKIEIDDAEQFHVYAAEWEEDQIRWYVDGQLYHSTKKGIPQEDMYIIFTLAVGGDWPGFPDSTTVFPCSMAIDYVRVYTKM